VKKNRQSGLSFIIDRPANSIINIITGDSFPTDISIIGRADLKSITPRHGWQFSWNDELTHPERDVYKLTIVNNQDVIQGLISIEVKTDHVFLHLIESASFNKGKNKVYSGVPADLVAFACKLSFQRGYEGHVSFYAKTKLIQHYKESLGAVHLGGNLMIIETNASMKLVNYYFPAGRL
jgi:hypothetical protein